MVFCSGQSACQGLNSAFRRRETAVARFGGLVQKFCTALLIVGTRRRGAKGHQGPGLGLVLCASSVERTSLFDIVGIERRDARAAVLGRLMAGSLDLLLACFWKRSFGLVRVFGAIWRLCLV